jgi:translation initiation factor IF-2
MSKLPVAEPTRLFLGFNTKVDAQARSHAEKLNITIQVFDIIYKLIRMA